MCLVTIPSRRSRMTQAICGGIELDCFSFDWSVLENHVSAVIYFVIASNQMSNGSLKPSHKNAIKIPTFLLFRTSILSIQGISKPPDFSARSQPACFVWLQVLTLCRPVDSRLEHVDFDSLLQCLSVGKLLQVFASLLLERRVIFIADKLR